jgi:hypothetical protein
MHYVLVLLALHSAGVDHSNTVLLLLLLPSCTPVG